MTDCNHRRTTRRHAPDAHGVLSTRIRPGFPARLIDVSTGGALLETSNRLLPGKSVELVVQGHDDRRATIRARVVRCSVARVHPSAISYRGAVVFDQHLPWFAEGGYDVPGSGAHSAASRADVTQPVL
jgi:PilZ domain-containing protein